MKEIGEIKLINRVYLPDDMFENIPAPSNDEGIIDKIRQLPLEKSVPLMMKIILNASSQEIANYHKVSRQSVVKKNKSSLNKLKTYL